MFLAQKKKIVLMEQQTALLFSSSALESPKAISPPRLPNCAQPMNNKQMELKQSLSLLLCFLCGYEGETLQSDTVIMRLRITDLSERGEIN